MSDPSGAPPALLWPTRLVRPEKRTVYLDLNHWIALSQAATGHREGVQYSDTLDACKAAAQAGVLFPISSVSYIEVSKIRTHGNVHTLPRSWRNSPASTRSRVIR